MPAPDVTVETLDDPSRYTLTQIARACGLAQLLNRGKLVLVEPPDRERR
jgi:hypothetical protein